MWSDTTRSEKAWRSGLPVDVNLGACALVAA